MKKGAAFLNCFPSSRQLKKYKFFLPAEIYLLAVFMQLASKGLQQSYLEYPNSSSKAPSKRTDIMSRMMLLTLVPSLMLISLFFRQSRIISLIAAFCGLSLAGFCLNQIVVTGIWGREQKFSACSNIIQSSQIIPPISSHFRVSRRHQLLSPNPPTFYLIHLLQPQHRSHCPPIRHICGLGASVGCECVERTFNAPRLKSQICLIGGQWLRLQFV